MATTLPRMTYHPQEPAYRLDELSRPTGKPKRRNRALVVVLAAVVVVVLIAAGALTYVFVVRDSGGTSGGAPIAGCTVGSTEELYVQATYTCADGTRVVTFASEQARDDYLKVATHFGAVVVEQGDTWARIRI